MKRILQLFLLFGLAGFLLPFGTKLAAAAGRPTYVIVFVPLNWQGSWADFETAAQEHGAFFVQESGVGAYADVTFHFLEEGLERVSPEDPWLVGKVVKFGLKRQPADRYVGLTDQDLAPGGYSQVAGWTGGPDSLGMVVEVHRSLVTAHELGHTFGLCDEYLYEEWSRQNEERTCPNPFPPDCRQEEGVLCDGLPAPDGRHSIMTHAGLRGAYAYNEPSYDHLQQVFAELFAGGATAPPLAEPPPTPTPGPTPEPLSSPVVVGGPTLTRVDAAGTRELATGPAFHTTSSADGRWLAFAAPYTGNLDLYRVPAAGGAVEQLTESPAQDSHPAWLADGERLIFVSNRGGAPALYLLEISSGEQTRLTLPAPASWPAVSPDGARLAFAAAPPATGDWDIYEVALDAAGRPVPDTVRRRTFVAGSDIAPAWRPDGTALAFAGNRGEGLRLFLLELEEELAYSLTEMRASQWAPRWLDEERLLFHAYDGRRLQVYLLDLETGALDLLNTDLTSAAWPAPLSGHPPRAAVAGPEKE